MTDRPIVMSDHDVRGIIYGKKTQFRRKLSKRLRSLVHKIGPGCMPDNDPAAFGFEDEYGEYWMLKAQDPEYPHEHKIPCPFGEPGDRLWARETWAEISGFCDIPGPVYRYRADPDDEAEMASDGLKWSRSAIMPRGAARIWLLIENVRVERLNDITIDDVKREGVAYNPWAWVVNFTLLSTKGEPK